MLIEVYFPRAVKIRTLSTRIKFDKSIKIIAKFYLLCQIWYFLHFYIYLSDIYCELSLNLAQVGGPRIDLGGNARLRIGERTCRKIGLCLNIQTVTTNTIIYQ